MPRHEFRTIEAFVIALEGMLTDAQRLHVEAFNDSRSDAAEYWDGRAAAYKRVLQIIRTSNLGIVYPLTEQGDKS